MSQAVAFDTFRFVRRLKDAGVPEEQAEAFSDAIRESQDARLGELATKADLQEVKAELQEVKAGLQSLKADMQADLQSVKADMQADLQSVKADMQMLESNMQKEMKDQELRLLKWMFGLLAGQAALIVTVLKVMGR